MELPEDYEGYVIEAINNHRIDFSRRVLYLDMNIIHVGPQASILLKLQVKDAWDVQNFKFDIKCGIFHKRFSSWLLEHGVKVDYQAIQVSVIETTEGMKL